MSLTTEQEQLAAVNGNGHAIKHIDNPSEAVQLTAIAKYEHAIQRIDHPSNNAIRAHKLLWEI